MVERQGVDHQLLQEAFRFVRNGFLNRSQIIVYLNFRLYIHHIQRIHNLPLFS